MGAARLANAGRAVRHRGRGDRGFVASRGGFRRGAMASAARAAAARAGITATVAAVVAEQAEQVQTAALLLAARVAARIALGRGFAARFASVRTSVRTWIAARVAAAAIKQAAQSGEQFAHRVAALLAAWIAARVAASVRTRIAFGRGFAARFTGVGARIAAAFVVRAKHPIEQLEAVALATNSDADDQCSQKASPFHRTSSPSTVNQECAHFPTAILPGTPFVPMGVRRDSVRTRPETRVKSRGRSGCRRANVVGEGLDPPVHKVYCTSAVEPFLDSKSPTVGSGAPLRAMYRARLPR